MPKVKIQLNKHETIEEADEALLKALLHHVNGDVHLKESFDDPAMVDISQRMADMHEKVYKEMLQEIIEALDEGLSGN